MSHWRALAVLMCLAAHRSLAQPLDERPIDSGSTELRVSAGTFDVPERRDDDSSSSDRARHLTIAYVRIQRAASPTRYAHMLLAGGPGDSGVKQALDLVRRADKATLDLFDGDIIAMDQRGSGLSSPSLALSVAYQLPLDESGSQERWLTAMRAAVAEAVQQLHTRGIRTEAYTTRESADDVDALRQALGYEHVTLWGRSYGTHLAMMVLRRHPQSVSKLVLVAPEGPDDTYKLPSQVEPVLHRLGQRTGNPGLVARMRRVIARLRASPVSVDVTDPTTRLRRRVALSGFDLQWLTAQALGDPRRLFALPRAYRAMERGNFQDLARVALLERSRAGIRNAMGPLMDAASGASPSRYARIDSEAVDALLGDALNFPQRSLAALWSAGDVGESLRAPVTSLVPAILFVGDLDARTPIDNAQALATGMPNARVVVVENAAHAFDFFGNAELLEQTRRFLHGDPPQRERVVLPMPQL